MKKLLALSIAAILLVSAFSACQSKLPEDDSLVIENNYLAAECAESKMTSDGAGLYFCYSPYNLHYIDTDTQDAAVLCSKPDCPHYVENPGIESLDCFAQMIYDQAEIFITIRKNYSRRHTNRCRTGTGQSYRNRNQNSRQNTGHTD